MTQTDNQVIEGCGNVFADLGLHDAGELLLQAQLASHIRQIIKRRRLSQVAVASLMGIGQPEVSALLDGRLTNFSSERLMRLLTALGQDVEIRIGAHEDAGRPGRITVTADGGAG
jgi:predicted XRE-type DNA-binding protein